MAKKSPKDMKKKKEPARKKMAHLVTSMSPAGHSGESDAASAAQDLIFDAWEAQSGRKRIQLAKKALELWPDCADAYVILGEDEAKTIEEVVEYYEEGVRAGKRALGRKGFEESAGHFWGVLETRPYMRARAGLADTLILLGRKDEAAQHLREMLNLNPNDNQGNRYELASLLIELDKDEELDKLLADNEGDNSAAFSYSRALRAFRRDGDLPRSRSMLADAFESNPHVPEYMVALKKLPRQLPETIGIGNESEGIYCTYTYQLGWARTEGALEWMENIWIEFGGKEPETGLPVMEQQDLEIIRSAVQETVMNQINDRNPPETKKTYDRLRSEGFSDDEAMGLIGSVVLAEMTEIYHENRIFDENKYVKALSKLPELLEDN